MRVLKSVADLKEFRTIRKLVLSGPDSGGEETVVFVRALSMAEAEEIQKLSAAPTPDKPNELNTEKFADLFVARGLVDESGARVFSDEEAIGLSKCMDQGAVAAIIGAVTEASGVNVPAGKVAAEGSREPTSSADGPKSAG